MNLTEAVAKRTRELLYEKNKTQHRLIKETCLDKTTIQTILKGKTKDVRLSTVYLIAQSFGMTLSEFLNPPYFNEANIDI